MFNDQRFMKYFVVQQNERALCMLCLKRFSIKWHYTSGHSVQYEGILGRCGWIKPINWRIHCKGQQKMISLCINNTLL